MYKIVSKKYNFVKEHMLFQLLWQNIFLILFALFTCINIMEKNFRLYVATSFC